MNKGIFCVDLTKYNHDQLSRVCQIIGIGDGSLQEAKRNGTKKVYFDHENRLFIGEVVSDGDKYATPHYKNLILTKEFSHLSKKEKDKLLKMDGYQFNTKKNGKNPFFDEVELVTESTEILKELPKVVLEIDAILDKISKFGMKSLTLEEKEFLDNESKK